MVNPQEKDCEIDEPSEKETRTEFIEGAKSQTRRKVLEFHKKFANDPNLLPAFTQQFDVYYKSITHLPRKYKELIMVAIGCARNDQTTINVHGKLALENGATIEKLGETLSLVFFSVRCDQSHPRGRGFRTHGDRMIPVKMP